MTRVNTTIRRSARLVAGAAVLAFGLAACVPDTGTAPPTSGAVLSVSATELTPGQTVTVSGTGFTVSGNTGTRPPLAGSPAGVYVTFGRFAPVWKPSANAGGRTILVQKWAVPAASRDVLVGFPWFVDPAELVTIAADGSWSTTITVPANTDVSNADYGIAVYPGSGASNTGEELIERVTVSAPVNA